MSIQANIPVLYSFRRCPYAIRARMSIAYSGMQVELREVELKHKPAALLQASPKATVPVLVLSDGQVIDESRDIMLWALQQYDPDHWLATSRHPLIDENDYGFKRLLDRYKYADRFPEHPQSYYQQQCRQFLEKLENAIKSSGFIESAHLSYADIAIFPFIRQCYFVDCQWFDSLPYPHLQHWLQHLLAQPLFTVIMQKTPVWQPSQVPVFFHTGKDLCC